MDRVLPGRNRAFGGMFPARNGARPFRWINICGARDGYSGTFGSGSDNVGKNMTEELAESIFNGSGDGCNNLGSTLMNSRSYLVLLGHSKFKALELAARLARPAAEDL